MQGAGARELGAQVGAETSSGSGNFERKIRQPAREEQAAVRVEGATGEHREQVVAAFRAT